MLQLTWEWNKCEGALLRISGVDGRTLLAEVNRRAAVTVKAALAFERAAAVPAPDRWGKTKPAH